MRMSYSGKVRIEEASEAALRAVLEADLREQRGQGTAKARMTMLVSEAGSGSQVATVTAVKLSGRAAQMAQGVIDDVADRLVGEMASCLAARFEPAGEGQERQAPPEAKPINGVRLMLQVLWTKIKRAFGGRRGEQMNQPDFTLSAGPTMSSPRVQQALGRPMVFDYDPAFLAHFKETEGLVAQLFRTSKDVVLMQGEALLGLEATARAVVRPGMRCLNLVSGIYAAWFTDWLRDFGAEVSELRVPYDEAIEPDAVRAELQRLGDVELVALVHSETPCGIENPLAEIAPIVKEAGALMYADVVSAVGGTDVRVDDWGVDIAVAGIQKCLGGPPGVAPCVVSEEAWKAIEANPEAPRGTFLSLLDWRETWIASEGKKFPYTPSVSDVFGVHAAVGGVPRPRARRGDRPPRLGGARLPGRRSRRWAWSCGRRARRSPPTASPPSTAPTGSASRRRCCRSASATA